MRARGTRLTLHPQGLRVHVTHSDPGSGGAVTSLRRTAPSIIARAPNRKTHTATTGKADTHAKIEPEVSRVKRTRAAESGRGWTRLPQCAAR